MNNKNIYVFGLENPMSKNRQDCKTIDKVSQCNVILITPEKLNKYILNEHPLHPSYYYLSEVHKSDYLRTYFMRFYGGGYSDIKNNRKLGRIF